MSRDWTLYWADMQEAVRRIVVYMEGMDSNALTADNKTRDAVLRNLEIIGEAAKRLPRDIRIQHPEIDWRRIAGFRDIIAHAYFGIDSAILWDIISNKVPELHKNLNPA